MPFYAFLSTMARHIQTTNAIESFFSNVRQRTDQIDPHVLAELAQEAEEAGWDGVFLWACIDVEKTLGPSGREVCDPWIALAAIVVHTERIRLGPMVTPFRVDAPGKWPARP